MSPLLLLVAIVLLLRHLYYRLRWRLPPGPRPWPVVGNLYHMKPVRFRCFAEWAQRYGPIISVWQGSTLNVVVSSSAVARQVLKEQDHLLADRHRSRTMEEVTKQGQDLIWADYGPHYVKVRKLCTAALFSAKTLAAMRPIREDEVTAMAESIYRSRSRSRSVVVGKYVGAVAFNNITRTVFGKRCLDSEGRVIHRQGEEMKAIAASRLRLAPSRAVAAAAEHVPWLRWLFPLDDRAFAEYAARKDRLTRQIMSDSRGGAGHHHFCKALLAVREEYNLSDDTISGLLWDMIHAGMDTTAISVEWAMAEVVKNPRVQQKAQEELERVIGHGRVMTEQDIPDLPYLRCVAKESLRLHPPTPLMLPHRASADVSIGGFRIPKGTPVHVNVWDNPSEFRPERFLEEDIDVKGHDFRVLPFGAGRRVCPGAQLAMDLVTSMIGHLLHHFSWAPPDGVRPEEIDLTETIAPGRVVTSIKTPLEAVPTPRLPPNLYKRTMVADI